MSFNQSDYSVLTRLNPSTCCVVVFHAEWWCSMKKYKKCIKYRNSSFSWMRPGYNELRCSQGSAYPNNVVSAWPGTQEVWRGEHLYQEHGRVHWQQGAVRYLLNLWQHSVLQGEWPASSFDCRVDVALWSCLHCFMKQILIMHIHVGPCSDCRQISLFLFRTDCLPCCMQDFPDITSPHIQSSPKWFIPLANVDLELLYKCK